MVQCQNRCSCICDGLECGDHIDVVFENGRVVSGKICDLDYEEKLLTLRTRCGKCILINGEYVMYICKDCNQSPSQTCR